MRKIKSIIYIYIITSMSFYTSGQDYIPKVIPSSPQSQIIDRYVDHPVTEYNGLTEITIPLYEINLRNLTIPISLSYHAGGIKYNPESAYLNVANDVRMDGELGAGWSINTIGARVSRKIQGKPDEQFPLYNEGTFQNVLAKGNKLDVDRYLAGVNYFNSSQSKFIEASHGYLDGEPDLFTYSLPTTMGHFVRDRSLRETFIIEQNNDRIHMNDNLASCIITDDMGNNFYLGYKDINGTIPVETVYSDFYKETPSALLLSKITTPSGEEVNFVYREIKSDRPRSNKGLRIAEAKILMKEEYLGTSNEASMSDSKILSISNRHYTEFVLDKIITEQEIITFERYGSQYGCPSNIITSILVRTKDGDFIKRIRFSYSRDVHSLLESVNFVDGYLKDEKVFSCEYYHGLYQSPIYVTSDQWGYYKENRWSPPFSDPSHKAFIHSDFLKTKILNDVKIDQLTSPGSVPGNAINVKVNDCEINNSLLYDSFEPYTVDRSENLSPHYYSLRKITYPTGGTVEYVYEPHQYKETSFGKKIITGGGQRIKKIITKENASSFSKITEYTYGKNGDGVGIPNFIINSTKFIDTQITLSKVNVATNSQSALMNANILKNVTKIFSTDPFIEEYSDFNVCYEFVSCKQYEEKKNNLGEYIVENGRTDSKYLIPKNYQEGIMLPSVPNMWPYTLRFNCSRIESYKLGYKPSLLYKKVYNKENQLILKEEYSYIESDNKSIIKGLKTDQKVFFSEGFNLNPNQVNQLYNVYDHINNIFTSLSSRIETGKYLLTQSLSTEYIKDGKDSINITESYKYDEINRIVSKSSLLNGKLNSENYIYPTMLNGGKELLSRNILSTKVEIIKKNGEKEIGRLRYMYDNSIFPSKIETSYTGPTQLKTEITFDKYDDKGNILQYTTKEGVTTTCLWSYNGRYPIAQINNASLQQVAQSLSISIDQLSKTKNPDISIIRELQKNMPQSNISIYEYNDINKISSITDISGLQTKYQYDSFNRLNTISDNDNMKISSYYYNYANTLAEITDTTNLDIDLVEMDVPINKTYGINKTLKPFYIRIEGTGSYELDWTLCDSSGNVTDRLEKSARPYFQIKRIKKVGMMRLTCVVTDIKSKKTRTFQKDFEAIIEPIEPFSITTTNDYFIIKGTGNFKTSYVEGGSGEFEYEWLFYKGSSFYKQITTTDNSIAYEFEDTEYSFLVCQVVDKITGKKTATTFNLGIILGFVNFENIRTTNDRLNAYLRSSGDVEIVFSVDAMSYYGDKFSASVIIGSKEILFNGRGTKTVSLFVRPGTTSISFIRRNIGGQAKIPINIRLRIEHIKGNYKAKTSDLSCTLN